MQDRKPFISLAAALVMAAGFTACSSDDDLQRHDAGGRTPITLTSSVATRAVDQNLQSTQIESGVQVGVYVTSGGQLIENGDNNRLTATGNGSFTGETMFFPEEGTVSVYAYAPYNAAWTGSQGTERTFTVPIDQSTSEGYLAADLMSGMPVGGNSFGKDAEEIQLQFTHKLTKLNINFNTGDTGLDLKGATVSVLNVMPTTTFTVSTGAIGSAQGNATEIKAAVFAKDATAFTASAIFVPQAVDNSVPFVRVTLADGTGYDAKLAELTDFAGSTKYNYTMNFTGGGQEPIEGSLVLESTVTDWTDGGNLASGEVSESKAVGIGDYMLSDGTFVTAAELTSENKAKVVAVVFSKEVSQADAEAGYNAYAMGVERFGDKGWQINNVSIGANINSFTQAFADLDGLSKTQDILASDEYAALPEEDLGKNFVNYTNYSAKHKLPETGTSQWFTPAFGQMVQIFNNLGGANLTADMTLPGEGNFSSPMYYTTDQAVLDKINAYVTALGKSEMFVTGDGGALLYLTVSEQSTTGSWAFQTRDFNLKDDPTTYKWGFGRNGSKANAGRSVAPCVAVTLPEAQ